ncbi:hypothetical protein SCUP234_07392 [Seiridium cupressi]
MANVTNVLGQCYQLVETDSGSNRLGWVSPPDFRSTISIIWTCVLVIFTCTWTVMHINLPTPHETWKDITLRKARWAMFIIYAPEAVTLLAACQWQSARSSREEMRALGFSWWTTTHGFFADSGGFVLVSPDMPPFPVNSRAIHYLVSRGYISIPSVTRAEIWDRSKSDHFAKFVAVVQMTYLFCQVIARAIQGLDSSCFEIVTVAFCVCAVATSLFWMDKPKDVTVAIPIEMKFTLNQVLLEAGSVTESPWLDTPMDFVEQPGWTVWNRRAAFRTFGGLQQRPIQRIPNDYIVPPATIRIALVTWFITVLHPAIHMVKWNFEFPTLLEQYVWRFSSASLLAVLFVWGVVEVLSVKPGLDFTVTLLGIWVNETTRQDSWWRSRALDFPGAMSSLLYFVARTALIVETILSLRQMPLSAFQTVIFSQYMPHFT